MGLISLPQNHLQAMNKSSGLFIQIFRAKNTT
jgi:hypothetical protein